MKHLKYFQKERTILGDYASPLRAELLAVVVSESYAVMTLTPAGKPGLGVCESTMRMN